MDGTLGIGSSLQSTLSVGAHLITAEALDADGLTGQSTIVIALPEPGAMAGLAATLLALFCLARLRRSQPTTP